MGKQMKTDVVIIGSGLGGVLCGALLGRDGYQVTILEKQDFPGGRYTTFEKNGYKINTGAYAVGLHGMNGPLWKLLTDIGVNIETLVTPPHHIWAGGKDIALPAKSQLQAIIQALSKNNKESERLINGVYQALRWQEPSDEITCDQWLYQYTDNALIHGFFDFFSRSMTATYYSEFQAGEYFRLMRSFGKFGNHTAMPKNGQKTTMDSLMRILEKWKVNVLLESRAEKIITSNGKIEGVVAVSKGGQIEIDTNIVISDIGPKHTVKLAGEQNVDKGYLLQVSKVEETMAVVIVFGYEKPIINAPYHIQLIEWDRLSALWEANHVWPDYAPPGRQNLITYATMKTNDTQKELNLIKEQSKSQCPALDKAEVVATLMFKGDWPVLRAKPTRCLNIRSPIYGLYLAGDAVNPSGFTCGEGISFSSPAIAEDIRNRFPKRA
jgi:phytoene dehydrogenase-like protein